MGRTNVSEVLPTGQLSNIPWRRADVKYTNNEAYFDVIEEIDAIIDRQGATVFSEIQGYVSFPSLLVVGDFRILKFFFLIFSMYCFLHINLYFLLTSKGS